MGKIVELNKYKYKPRIAIGLFILDKNKKEILLLKRDKKDGLYNNWGPVCGKLEYLESIEKGIIREAREEIGLNIKSKDIMFLGVSERIKEYPHYIVIWYKYITNKNSLKINLNNEFSEYAWFSINKALEKISPELNKVIEKLI